MPELTIRQAQAVARMTKYLTKVGYVVGDKGLSVIGGIGKFFKPVKFITAGFGAAYFYLFIIEEAVQTAGFGVFVLIQGKQWRDAAIQNRRYRELAEIGQTMVGIFKLNAIREDIQETLQPATEQIFDISAIFKESIKGIFGDATTNFENVKKIMTEEQIPKFDENVGILAVIFLPFEEFFNSAVSSADAYDARISAEFDKIKPEYKRELDELKNKFKDDNFKLKIAHDERIDKLAIEKEKQKDELKLAKKRENDELLSDAKKGFDSETVDAVQQIRKELDDELEKIREEERKAIHEYQKFASENELEKLEIDNQIAKIRRVFEDDKDNFRIAAEEAIQKIREEAAAKPDRVGLSAKQKADKKNNITARYDELDRKLKVQFDELDRLEKENVHNATVLIEKIHENEKTALREQFFQLELTDEEKTIWGIEKPPIEIAPIPITIPAPISELPIIPTQPPPAPVIPPPISELPPEIPPLPTTPTQQVTLSVHLRNPANRTDVNADVVIGGTGQIVKAGSFFSRVFDVGSVVKFSVRTSGNIFIAPLDEQFNSFTVDMTADKGFLFDIGTKEELHPPVPFELQPLPADVDGFSGAAHTIEFGLLEVPRALHDANLGRDAVIIPQREFSVAEVSDVQHEILGFRIVFSGPLSISEPFDLDYLLLRPDGSIFNVPEEVAPHPQPLPTGSYYNWLANFLVLNGLGGDLVGKGLYKIIINVDTGAPVSGKYELWFKVV